MRLIDRIAAAAGSAGSRASAAMTKFENVNQIPATMPLPTAATIASANVFVCPPSVRRESYTARLPLASQGSPAPPGSMRQPLGQARHSVAREAVEAALVAVASAARIRL